MEKIILKNVTVVGKIDLDALNERERKVKQRRAKNKKREKVKLVFNQRNLQIKSLLDRKFNQA